MRNTNKARETTNNYILKMSVGDLIRFIYYIYNYRLLYYLSMERMEKPKFIKEIEKSEWKERAKCWRWYIRVYWELDHKPMVELESLEIVVKELHKVEEENKKLKERINVLYEFIERNDKLVDEVIAEEDLDKLNRYIYIDDDLVDRTLESED